MKINILAVVWITILAVMLRSHIVDLNFVYDEVYSVLAVEGILTSGFPIMGSGLLYLRAFPLTYIMSIPVALFGMYEVAIRLVPLLIGIVSILAVFAFLVKSASRTVAIATALVMALSPWHIFYSIYARSYMFQALLFFILVTGIYVYLNSTTKKWLSISVLASILLSLLSPISILSVPVFGYMLYNEKSRLKALQVHILCYVLSIIIALFLPSAIENWESSMGNPYSLIAIRSFILPNTYFFEFMLMNMPVGLVALFGSFIYFWKEKSAKIVFPFFVLSAFFILSFFNPFQNLQPRYLSNFIIVIYATYGLFLHAILKRHVFILSLVMLVVMTDVLKIGDVLNLDHGSPTRGTLQVSESWDAFPDTKSAVYYVNTHARRGDVVISLQPRGQTEVYSNTKPSYYLRTVSYRNEGHDENGQFVDDYSRIPMITSLQQLKSVLIDSRLHSRTVWIVSSKSLDPQLGHIDKKTSDYLVEHGAVEHRGRDQYSKVIVFR